jgi:hypothetical protein
MTNERNTLPDARAVALVEMACDLARTEPDLVAFGKANADAFKAFDPPTLAAARTAYARRLQALRGDQR